MKTDIEPILGWARSYRIRLVSEATFQELELEGFAHYFGDKDMRRLSIQDPFSFMEAMFRHRCTNYDEGMSLMQSMVDSNIMPRRLKENVRTILQGKASAVFTEWWEDELSLYHGMEPTRENFVKAFQRVQSGGTLSIEAVTNILQRQELLVERTYLVKDGNPYEWEVAARELGISERTLRRSMGNLYKGKINFPLYELLKDFRIFDIDKGCYREMPKTFDLTLA